LPLPPSEVMEVEVNPFRVFPKGEGAIVLDARLRVKCGLELG